tara:strand:- start:62 stop:409 length:348 start_codon:yes stop_codon:yes gene_type:complete
MSNKMKTLKDLGRKHYKNTHYSFDVYYYPEHNDDLYIGNLSRVEDVRGYEFRLRGDTIESLVKQADMVLTLCKSVRIDANAMKTLVLDWNMNNPKDLNEQVEIYNLIKQTPQKQG